VPRPANRRERPPRWDGRDAVSHPRQAPGVEQTGVAAAEIQRSHRTTGCRPTITCATRRDQRRLPSRRAEAPRRIRHRPGRAGSAPTTTPDAGPTGPRRKSALPRPLPSVITSSSRCRRPAPLRGPRRRHPQRQRQHHCIVMADDGRLQAPAPAVDRQCRHHQCIVRHRRSKATPSYRYGPSTPKTRAAAVRCDTVDLGVDRTVRCSAP
jgi:hypothetical protein